MPFIHTITNCTVTAEQERLLREAFGRAIEQIPGKSEHWLMLALSDHTRMAFRGQTDGALAMLEVSIFGEAEDEALNRLTRALTDEVHRTLGIPTDGIYIKYTSTSHWGYDGENF